MWDSKWLVAIWWGFGSKAPNTILSEIPLYQHGLLKRHSFGLKKRRKCFVFNILHRVFHGNTGFFTHCPICMILQLTIKTA